MKHVLVILNVVDNGLKYNYRQVFEIGDKESIDHLAALAEKELFKDDQREHYVSSPVHVYECSTSVIAKSLYDVLKTT